MGAIKIFSTKNLTTSFKEKDLNKHTPLIAIHPGTSKKTPFKRWDISYYATVPDKLTERLDANILWK